MSRKLGFKILVFIFVFSSEIAQSAVFKCKNSQGAFSYQSAPCPSDEVSSEINVFNNTVKKLENLSDFSIYRVKLGMLFNDAEDLLMSEGFTRKSIDSKNTITYVMSVDGKYARLTMSYTQKNARGILYSIRFNSNFKIFKTVDQGSAYLKRLLGYEIRVSQRKGPGYKYLISKKFDKTPYGKMSLSLRLNITPDKNEFKNTYMGLVKYLNPTAKRNNRYVNEFKNK